jgi:hypothetical protein
LLNGFIYFGAPYAAGTHFYNNVGRVLPDAASRRDHNLYASGADGRQQAELPRRFLGSSRGSVVPNSDWKRSNVTGRTGAQVTRWLNTDLSVLTRKWTTPAAQGANGPLIGLLLWPQTDDAKDYLTPAGNRRRITTQAANAETENPYFSVEKNRPQRT